MANISVSSSGKVDYAPLIAEAAKDCAKTGRFLWISYPPFKKGDDEFFPTFIPIETECRAKTVGAKVGKEAYQNYLQLKGSQKNDFLDWLNQKEKGDMENFLPEGSPIFMNCIDFLYLTAYKANMLSKEQIITKYREHISCAIQGKTKDKYFGIPADRFKEIDDKAKNYDILVGVSKKTQEAVHAVFFIRGSRYLLGLGHWNMDGNEGIYPDTLKNFAAHYKKCQEDGDEIVFKYCSLEDFRSVCTA